jgi:actin-related protein
MRDIGEPFTLRSTSTSYEGRAERPGLENILVCGGGCGIGNVGSRLLSEVRALALPSLTPKLCALPAYMPESAAAYAAWVGGAVMTKALLNQSHFITKWDYEEDGPCAGYRKCA